MTREEALRLLDSEDSLRRLDAAREMAGLAEPGDRALLLARRRNEPDRWVRAAIDRALRRIAGPRIQDPTAADPDGTPLSEEQRLTATRLIAGPITHELRSILGSARTAARSEIPDFEASRTATALDRMDRFLLALDEIYRATVPPVRDEFDLSALVRDAARVVTEDGGVPIEIRLAGPDTALAIGDTRRVEVALINGLRNAVDAVGELPDLDDERAPILVTWGTTDLECWIAVADRGIGLSAGHEQAFDLGQTTKSKALHQGMGLAIARRSIHSLAGEVSLSAREGGGSIFEIRWPFRDLG